MASNHLIEQKITTTILYNIFQFSLCVFVFKDTPDKIQVIKNPYLQKKWPDDVPLR